MTAFSFIIPTRNKAVIRSSLAILHRGQQQQQQPRRIFCTRCTTKQRQHLRLEGTYSKKRWLLSSPNATTTVISCSSSSSSSLKRKLLGDEAIIPCRSILPLSVVNRPEIQSSLPLLGNLAYIGIASGFLMTDMLQLRILLVGGYTGLVAYHILRPAPLRIPLRWSAVFVLVNAGAACLLLADRYMAPLADDEQLLYETHFSSVLTRGQFYQLLSLSTRVELDDKTVLTVEGTPCQRLYFIESGQAKVYHHKDYAATIESGGFVNDVAFQRGGENIGAYGTVVASGNCSALVWDQAKLREHLQSRPEMDRNLKYMLSDHLVKSLLRQREARLRRQNATTSEPPPTTANGTTVTSPSQHHIAW